MKEALIKSTALTEKLEKEVKMWKDRNAQANGKLQALQKVVSAKVFNRAMMRYHDEFAPS